MITSIQKYSIHDGDGIRTTIFFKGCQMKCVWCHNPETQNYSKQVMYDKERCVGCKRCVSACPHKAISEAEGKVNTNGALCERCGTCLEYCVLNLREIVGEERTIEELITEVKKDEMFYEESGGGVTLSGGEVMTMDMDYIEELVRWLYKMGISINMDTCGYAPYENYERILPFVDTFLYDIKTMDGKLHKQYTGVGNELIFENLEKLNHDGARIYIRIPVIEEVNGTKEQIQDVIDYLKTKEIRAVQVNLLPYHNTGAGKYEKLGKVYEGSSLHTPSNEMMEAFAQQFKNAGFYNTKIGG